MANSRSITTLLRGIVLFTKFAFILTLANYATPQVVATYGILAATSTFSVYLAGFEFYTFSNRDIVLGKRSLQSVKIASQLTLFAIIYTFVAPLLVFYILPLYFNPNLHLGIVILVIAEHASSEIARYRVVANEQTRATIMLFCRQAAWAICLIPLIVLEPERATLYNIIPVWILGVLFSIAIGLPKPSSWFNGSANWKVDFRWIGIGIQVALPLFLSSLTIRTLFTADRYLFEYLNSIELLAVYTLYMNIAAAILSFVESGVFNFYYPRLIRTKLDKSRREMNKVFKEMRNQTILWLAGLTVVTTCLGPVVLAQLGTGIYSEHYSLFYVLVLSITPLTLGHMFQYVLYSAHKDRATLLANTMGMLSAGICFLLSYSSQPYWSVPLSIAVGTTIAATIKALTARTILS